MSPTRHRTGHGHAHRRRRGRTPVAPVAALAVAAALAAGGCGSSNPAHARASGAAPAAAGSVSAGDAIAQYAYSPATLRVRTGGTITFTNDDQTPHTATADNGSFDSGSIAQGQKKTLSFTKPGTYSFHCAFHAFMHGTVVVA